jgi:hypothetical protein
MEINIWPDFDELPAQAQADLVKYYNMSFEEQAGMAWVVKEHERRVQEVMEGMAAALKERFLA